MDIRDKNKDCSNEDYDLRGTGYTVYIWTVMEE